MSSAVASPLRTALFAVLGIVGVGGGAIVGVPAVVDAYQQHAYLGLIAEDATTTAEVKAALVLATFYESSFQVRLVPYRDEVSQKRPWTVCNGITDAGMPKGFRPIEPGRAYALAECYVMERELFRQYEAALPAYVTGYAGHTVWQKATYMDFIHHFGMPAFSTSTMRRKANAGDLIGACMEHAKWKYTTLPSGAKTVLAGLEKRANSNAEVCGWDFDLGEQPQAQVVFGDGFGDAV